MVMIWKWKLLRTAVKAQHVDTPLEIPWPSQTDLLYYLKTTNKQTKASNSWPKWVHKNHFLAAIKIFIMIFPPSNSMRRQTSLGRSKNLDISLHPCRNSRCMLALDGYRNANAHLNTISFPSLSSSYGILTRRFPGSCFRCVVWTRCYWDSEMGLVKSDSSLILTCENRY